MKFIMFLTLMTFLSSAHSFDLICETQDDFFLEGVTGPQRSFEIHDIESESPESTLSSFLDWQKGPESTILSFSNQCDSVYSIIFFNQDFSMVLSNEKKRISALLHSERNTNINNTLTTFVHCDVVSK